MGLLDANQALGLPAGTIRALIALILILLFAIIGVHLFRMVGALDPAGTNAVSAEGVALAQQLLTTVGTLVVAVSGFYFGTASAARGAMISSQATKEATRLAVTAAEGAVEGAAAPSTGRVQQHPAAATLTE